MEIPREVVEYAITLAKKHNSYVILNAAPASEIGEEYLRMVDCFVVNETEASYYSNTSITSVDDVYEICDML